MPQFFPFVGMDDTEADILATLKQSPRAAEIATPAVLKQLTPWVLKHDGNRQAAVELLTVIGPHGRSAVSEVARKLESGIQAEDRHVATFVLAFIGTNNRRAAAALLVALHDSDESVRAAAAESLGKVSIAEESVVNGLTAALDDESSAVRANAAEALKLLKSTESKP
ncbi:hypothetical protein GC176_17890 [bacterium]|nr:hypothetical protein [bacterium]